MIGEQDAVPYAAELMSAIVEERGITPKQLAARVGVNVATIYRYLSGDRTISPEFLTALWQLSGDKRIAEFIFGHGSVRVESMHAETVRIPPTDQMLEASARVVQSAADCLPYMGRILKDGRIDASDINAIAKFDKIAADVNIQFAQLSAALHAHAGRAKEAV